MDVEENNEHEIKSKNLELKQVWERKANAYNSIFIFLESKGLNEKNLRKFSDLLKAYVELI